MTDLNTGDVFQRPSPVNAGDSFPRLARPDFSGVVSRAAFTFDDDELVRVSVHEASHSVAHLTCGIPISLVTVDPAVAGDGRAGCVFGTPDNCDRRPLQEFSNHTLRDLMPEPLAIDGHTISDATCTLCFARTIAALAGTEGEKLIFPNRFPMDAASDIAKAKAIATIFARKSPATWLHFARVDAANMLAARRALVETIAEALIEHKTLDGATIGDIVAGLSTVQRAERARRKRMIEMTAGAAAFTAMTGGLTLQRI